MALEREEQVTGPRVPDPRYSISIPRPVLETSAPPRDDDARPVGVEPLRRAAAPLDGAEKGAGPRVPGLHPPIVLRGQDLRPVRAEFRGKGDVAGVTPES